MDHAGRRKDAGDVVVRVGGNAVEVESVKGQAEHLAFAQDHFPRKSALHRRQHEKLEQPAVVMDGHAPLLVVELPTDLAQIEVAIAHTEYQKHA